jgi:hypothetical protein
LDSEIVSIFKMQILLCALVGLWHLPIAEAGAEVEARLLYEFSNNTFIENLAIRQNGQLVLNTFDNAHIYTLSPSEPDPKPQLVAKVFDIDAVTGIAEVAPDVFAITGGINDIPTYGWEAGSGLIVLLDLSHADGTEAELRTVAKLPHAGILNWMASLPSYPHIVISIDSKTGNLFRIDTISGAVDIAFQDDELGLPANPVVPVGGNGIKIYDGYLYFTSSARGYFGRIQITPSGERAGEVEEISRLEAPPTSPGAAPPKFDDFIRGPDGNFYVAMHPRSLIKIEPDSGQQTPIMDGSSSVVLRTPTAVAFSKDQSKLYVVSAGADEALGGVFRGQVVEVTVNHFASMEGISLLE